MAMQMGPVGGAGGGEGEGYASAATSTAHPGPSGVALAAPPYESSATLLATMERQASKLPSAVHRFTPESIVARLSLKVG